MNDFRRAVFMLGLLAAALSSGAGEYHTDSKNICFDCHTQHNSQDHAYSGGPVRGVPNDAFGGGEAWLRTGPPDVELLKADSSQVCLACHDGMPLAPDVVGENTDNFVRQAGAIVPAGVPRPIADHGVDGATWGGHRLGIEAVPPGGTERMTLTCSSCHDPHGNDAYRSLRSPPGTARDSWGRGPRKLRARGHSTPIVSVTAGINDLSKDVFLRSPGGANHLESYSVGNVVFNEPKPGESAMDDFCRSCHTAIHDPPTGASALAGAVKAAAFVHPTTGAGRRLSRFTSRFDARPWRAGDAPNGKPTSPGQPRSRASTAWPSHSAVTCLTCHKAHGNRNRDALILRSSRGPLTEEGDAAGVLAGREALCGQCHEPGLSGGEVYR